MKWHEESYNDGYSYGYGSGSGSGYGDGYGYGSGYGYGDGDGSGSGSGSSYGYGYGYGLDYSIEITGGVIEIGCKKHSIEYWLKHGRAIAEAEGVPEISIQLLLNHFKRLHEMA